MVDASDLQDAHQAGVFAVVVVVIILLIYAIYKQKTEDFNPGASKIPDGIWAGPPGNSNLSVLMCTSNGTMYNYMPAKGIKVPMGPIQSTGQGKFSVTTIYPDRRPETGDYVVDGGVLKDLAPDGSGFPIGSLIPRSSCALAREVSIADALRL